MTNLAKVMWVFVVLLVLYTVAVVLLSQATVSHG
jgi:hypothetical protein